jgi:hypothetical protein
MLRSLRSGHRHLGPVPSYDVKQAALLTPEEYSLSGEVSCELLPASITWTRESCQQPRYMTGVDSITDMQAPILPFLPTSGAQHV